MDKTLLLNESMKSHLAKVQKAINMTEIVADDFIGIKCDIESIKNIESLINQLKALKIKLEPNDNICPTCGISIYANNTTCNTRRLHKNPFKMVEQE